MTGSGPKDDWRFYENTPQYHVSSDFKSAGFGYYAGRVGSGVVGALDAVTRQPLLQLHDMAAALFSVGYNEGAELLTGKNPMWFPKMLSGTAQAYANGTSQTELILGSNFVTGAGVLSYNMTTAVMDGNWGDVAEMSGGLAGGFLIGKGTSKYGGYGLAFDDIGAAGLGRSQAGSINLRLVTPNEGPVTFRAPPGATAAEIAQVRAYVDRSNDALAAGEFSPTGRVSTKGDLRTDASLAAAQERARASSANNPYQGHAGHVPDTTWTGKPQPYSWLDLSPRVNSSLGGQAGGYPLGFKPTMFIFEVPK